MNKLVLFNDGGGAEFGIYNSDTNEIICLCCGSLVEPDTYDIIMSFDWINISEMLKDGDY